MLLMVNSLEFSVLILLGGLLFHRYPHDTKQYIRNCWTITVVLYVKVVVLLLRYLFFMAALVFYVMVESLFNMICKVFDKMQACRLGRDLCSQQ